MTGNRKDDNTPGVPFAVQHVASIIGTPDSRQVRHIFSSLRHPARALPPVQQTPFDRNCTQFRES